MASNSFSVRRAPNLLGISQGRSSGSSAIDAFKGFTKEVRILAAQALNSAVEDAIGTVERQSRSLKPLNQFARGRRLSTPNLIKSAVIDFDHRPEMIKFAFDNYFKSGVVPVVSGAYAAAFQLYIGGYPGSYGNIRFGQRVEIVNVAPYARMLEVGYGEDGKPFVVHSKPHIVERIATQMMKRDWGRSAKIKFGFTDIPDPYTLKTDFHKGRDARKPGKTRKDREAGQPINYPTIIVEY